MIKQECQRLLRTKNYILTDHLRPIVNISQEERQRCMLHTHTRLLCKNSHAKTWASTHPVCEGNATQLPQVHSSKFRDISFLLNHETTALAGRKQCLKPQHFTEPKEFTHINHIQKCIQKQSFRKRKWKDNYQNMYLLDLLALPRQKTHFKLQH